MYSKVMAPPLRIPSRRAPSPRPKVEPATLDMSYVGVGARPGDILGRSDDSPCFRGILQPSDINRVMRRFVSCDNDAWRLEKC